MNSEREKSDNTHSIGVKTNLVIGGGILAATLLYSGVFEGKKDSSTIDQENGSYTTPLTLAEKTSEQANFDVVKCSWNDADRNYFPLSIEEVLSLEASLLPDCVLWGDGKYRPVLVQKNNVFFGKGYMGPIGEDFKE